MDSNDLACRTRLAGWLADCIREIVLHHCWVVTWSQQVIDNFCVFLPPKKGERRTGIQLEIEGACSVTGIIRSSRSSTGERFDRESELSVQQTVDKERVKEKAKRPISRPSKLQDCWHSRRLIYLLCCWLSTLQRCHLSFWMANLPWNAWMAFLSPTIFRGATS